MYNAKEIGVRISNLRKQQNWTQKELAEKLCLSSSAISKWENGDATPDIYRMYELSELFGVTVADMIGVESQEEAEREIARLQAQVMDHKRRMKYVWICGFFMLCLLVLAGIFLVKRIQKTEPVIVGIAKLQDYVLTLQLIEGSYETDLQMGPYFGGGWTGQYELVLHDAESSEVITRHALAEWQQELIFTEEFPIQLADYNEDGIMEFLIGQYGCSNYNFYRIYYITPELEIGYYEEIGELMITSKEMSPVLERNEDGTLYSYYNNAGGNTVTGVIANEAFINN